MLANRVDEAAARIPRLPRPPKPHRWWIDEARTYEPASATSLLAMLHVDAEQANVSWRTVLARATPLADALAAAGVKETDARCEWLNFVDRISLMLTWPDDPRVALTLARWLRGPPFYDPRRYRTRPHAHLAIVVSAIARRIIAIGDLRALTQLALVRRWFDDELRAAHAQALLASPPPRATDSSLATPWQAVLDDPFALAPRLVLADAYLERGDPRGELIALQCAPYVAFAEARAAGRAIDAPGLLGRGAERIDKLVYEHWYRWFGAVAPVVVGAKLKCGMLAQITVGGARTPAWAWRAVARDRELCAIEDVRAANETDPATFAQFVLDLPRMPRWIELDDTLLTALRAGAPTLGLIGVNYQVRARDPVEIAEQLLTFAPGLERITYDYGYQQHSDVIHEVANRFPRVKFALGRAR